MKKVLLLPLVLAASMSNAQPVQRAFPACGVSVTFSGIPAKTPQNYLDALASQGMISQGDAYFYKAEYDGTVSVESATCFCPSVAIVSALSEGTKGRNSFNLIGIGGSFIQPSEQMGGGVLKVTRYVNPKSNPTCFLQQEAVSNKGEAALKDIANRYFERLLQPL